MFWNKIIWKRFFWSIGVHHIIAMKENNLINIVSITVDAILSQSGVLWVNFTANFSYIDDNGITQQYTSIFISSEEYPHKNVNPQFPKPLECQGDSFAFINPRGFFLTASCFLKLIEYNWITGKPLRYHHLQITSSFYFKSGFLYSNNFS